MSFYNCTRCNRKYKTEKKLKWHLETAHAEASASTSSSSTTSMNRTYGRPQMQPQIMKKCPVYSCNKKYKTEIKLKKHVETKHYYDTHGGNNQYKINLKMKVNIYKLAVKYAMILSQIIDMEDSVIIAQIESGDRNTAWVQCAINLLPQKCNMTITDSELIRISIAQRDFARRLWEHGFCWSQSDWKNIMEDFECFLKMGLPYYDSNFCPTLCIDFLWHASMQDKQIYRELCPNEVIPHCSTERNPDEDLQRFEYFKEVFQMHFRRQVYLPSVNAPKSSAEINQTFQNLIIGLENTIIAEQKAETERQEAKIKAQIAREEKAKQAREAQLKREQAFCAYANLDYSTFRKRYYNDYMQGFHTYGYRGDDLEKYIDKFEEADRSSWNRFDSKC